MFSALLSCLFRAAALGQRSHIKEQKRGETAAFWSLYWGLFFFKTVEPWNFGSDFSVKICCGLYSFLVQELLHSWTLWNTLRLQIHKGKSVLPLPQVLFWKLWDFLSGVAKAESIWPIHGELGYKLGQSAWFLLSLWLKRKCNLLEFFPPFCLDIKACKSTGRAKQAGPVLYLSKSELIQLNFCV